MSTSSTEISAEPKVGQEVRVESVPHEWMGPLVGLKGSVGAVRHNPNVDAYRIDGLAGEPWWLAAGHLSVVEDDEKGAS